MVSSTCGGHSRRGPWACAGFGSRGNEAARRPVGQTHASRRLLTSIDCACCTLTPHMLPVLQCKPLRQDGCGVGAGGAPPAVDKHAGGSVQLSSAHDGTHTLLHKAGQSFLRGHDLPGVWDEWKWAWGLTRATGNRNSWEASRQQRGRWGGTGPGPGMGARRLVSSRNERLAVGGYGPQSAGRRLWGKGSGWGGRPTHQGIEQRDALRAYARGNQTDRQEGNSLAPALVAG